MGLEAFEKLPEDRKSLILSTGIKAFSEKSYKDVSTERITRECQISKGILFHYFGSKKEYYLCCLKTSMERLTTATEAPAGNDFYEILFDSMNRKMSVCLRYTDEMHMVNMASRDLSSEIAAEKAEILRNYMAAIHAESSATLRKALSSLSFRQEKNMGMVTKGLHLYINAVLNQYLLRYQQIPDLFFTNREQIKWEIKEYLDLMLYGICDEEAL